MEKTASIEVDEELIRALEKALEGFRVARKQPFNEQVIMQKQIELYETSKNVAFALQQPSNEYLEKLQKESLDHLLKDISMTWNLDPRVKELLDNVVKVMADYNNK